VKTVGPRSSTVLLAMDPQSQVGARVATTGFIGWVRGGGSGPMTFTLLDAHAALKQGQQLVTFGSENDRPYIPEIPIGTITKVESTPGAQTRTALVEPFTKFTALDPVAVVIAAPRDIPRDSLLPAPPPKPTPTAPASPPPATTGPSAGPSPGATKPGG
jgi:rod shape-determining protein MreC